MPTLPQRIERWLAENFTDYVDHDMLRDELIDVATGNRPASCEYERKAVYAIMNDH